MKNCGSIPCSRRGEVWDKSHQPRFSFACWLTAKYLKLIITKWSMVEVSQTPAMVYPTTCLWQTVRCIQVFLARLQQSSWPHSLFLTPDSPGCRTSSQPNTASSNPGRMKQAMNWSYFRSWVLGIGNVSLKLPKFLKKNRGICFQTC